uniref:Uncharacterized protein n=1 Tax=Candidatus Kentrum eta TaxID=2126337 RepID=A0A450VJT0_9GAMM|nr:MAG: hypothetical protein BECKH772A_GA0070896_104913 [Candidatus Kentron sp. H]VFK05857.1 MAG: hypothetical protein BECKH772A_GA0070896_105952 [Candidatus Kentron sp. H]VFK08136.1 MAG: hypothetical protein BECKH772B_GA0070898_108581 [Candidatus Kentron sp. H]VFK09979.1 MAG: hypothetical protein BECKH772C_GA0070978_106662 [Candidatus Kentron sp. H]
MTHPVKIPVTPVTVKAENPFVAFTVTLSWKSLETAMVYSNQSWSEREKNSYAA